MNGPLKDSDLKSINRALYQLNELLDKLEKAKCAGIECTENELRRQDLHAKLMAVKTAYFPGK